MGYNQLRRQIMNQRILSSLREVPAMGNIYYVFDADDTYGAAFQALVDQTYSDGTQAFHATLESAYTACTSGRNDVILLDAKSTHLISTGLAWSKNRIHVVGMDGGDRLVQQGAKIELTGAIDVAYLMKCTGVRNSFRNIKFIQSSTHANALTVLQFAGEGNLYKNCSAMFGTDSNTDLTTASEVVLGEDSGTFINCSWGNDNLLSTGARKVMAIDAIAGASSADGAKNNRFVDCEWIIQSSSASAEFIKVVDTAGAKFLNSFTRPQFHAIVSSGGGGIALTNAVQSVASFVDGTLDFYMPASFNCTNFCSTLTAGVMTYGPVTSVVAGEAGTPT